MTLFTETEHAASRPRVTVLMLLCLLWFMRTQHYFCGAESVDLNFTRTTFHQQEPFFVTGGPWKVWMALGRHKYSSGSRFSSSRLYTRLTMQLFLHLFLITATSCPRFTKPIWPLSLVNWFWLLKTHNIILNGDLLCSFPTMFILGLH